MSTRPTIAIGTTTEREVARKPKSESNIFFPLRARRPSAAVQQHDRRTDDDHKKRGYRYRSADDEGARPIGQANVVISGRKKHGQEHTVSGSQFGGLLVDIGPPSLPRCLRHNYPSVRIEMRA